MALLPPARDSGPLGRLLSWLLPGPCGPAPRDRSSLAYPVVTFDPGREFFEAAFIPYTFLTLVFDKDFCERVLTFYALYVGLARELLG